jgi:hypothetical protein
MTAADDDDQCRNAEMLRRPQVAQAHFLHYAEDIEQRQILEARLLTEETFAEIAARLGVDPMVVEYYEQIFFNIRDRLKNSDWIRKVILGPPAARVAGSDGVMTVEQRGYVYRLFAYCGGPLVLDTIIAGIGSNPPPQSREAVGDWMDESLKIIVRSKTTIAARLLAVDGQNCMQLLKLALRQTAKTATSSRKAGQADFESQAEAIIAAVEREFAEVIGTKPK